MDRINMDFLPMVNNHAKYVKEQKIAREMEKIEKAKQFTMNLCGIILLVATCYVLYIAGCCM